MSLSWSLLNPSPLSSLSVLYLVDVKIIFYISVFIHATFISYSVIHCHSADGVITKYLLTCDIVHVVLFSWNINAIILLFKKLSQTPELKTANSFYSVSMSQEDSLDGSSAQALSRSAHKVSGKLCSHLKAHLGKDISTATLRLLAEFIRSHSILLFRS